MKKAALKDVEALRAVLSAIDGLSREEQAWVSSQR